MMVKEALEKNQYLPATKKHDAGWTLSEPAIFINPAAKHAKMDIDDDLSWQRDMQRFCL